MIILFWLAFFIPINLLASNFPDIFGCFCEGGIITGRLESKDKIITIDDKRIRVSEEGDFIFAFGRKFKESITISVNGINKEYEIKDKKYKKEIIRGLPSRKVEPNKEDIKKIKSDQKKIKLVKSFKLSDIFSSIISLKVEIPKNKNKTINIPLLKVISKNKNLPIIRIQKKNIKAFNLLILLATILPFIQWMIFQ